MTTAQYTEHTKDGNRLTLEELHALPMAVARWVPLDTVIHDFSLCRYCGSGHGAGPETNWAHEPAVCLACGTVQCGDKATCRVCTYGLLLTRYGKPKQCGYAHCTGMAVAKAPRVGRVCEDHSTTVKTAQKSTVTIAEYIKACVLDLPARFLFAPFPGPGTKGRYSMRGYVKDVYARRQAG